jgi:hypothetical protein
MTECIHKRMQNLLPVMLIHILIVINKKTNFWNVYRYKAIFICYISNNFFFTEHFQRIKSKEIFFKPEQEL